MRNKCPICGGVSLQVYAMKQLTGATGDWHHCSCGVVFQDKEPEQPKYKKSEYMEQLEIKESIKKYQHYVRCYLPLIEESTNGRYFLDVGNMNNRIRDSLWDRGWVTYCIDRQDYRNGAIVDDFMNHEFELKFDLIWLSHVFEEFKDPLKALDKVVKLMSSTGLLFVATPDTDLINVLGPPAWGHWSKEHKNIYWNVRSLKKQLEARGLDVILQRKNIFPRFIYGYDFHMIAQKKIT